MDGERLGDFPNASCTREDFTCQIFDDFPVWIQVKTDIKGYRLGQIVQNDKRAECSAFHHVVAVGEGVGDEVASGGGGELHVFDLQVVGQVDEAEEVAVFREVGGRGRRG